MDVCFPVELALIYDSFDLSGSGKSLVIHPLQVNMPSVARARTDFLQCLPECQRWSENLTHAFLSVAQVAASVNHPSRYISFTPAYFYVRNAAT